MFDVKLTGENEDQKEAQIFLSLKLSECSFIFNADDITSYNLIVFIVVY